MKRVESGHRFESEAYAEAFRRRVCSHCIDFGADGVCHSLDDRGCAIFRFVPEVVSITKQVRAKKMDPYIRAVRRCICSRCDHEQHDGKCPLRETLDCGLDRYLPLVVDAVEKLEESGKTD